MLKQGSSDPTSPRREASLFDLPGLRARLFSLHFNRRLAGVAHLGYRLLIVGTLGRNPPANGRRMIKTPIARS